MTNKADGVWGYSSPNKPQVLFSVDNGVHADTIALLIRKLHPDAQVIVGTGCWKGTLEQSIAVDQDAFWDVWDRGVLGLVMQDQTHVLILGKLEARNWRKAALHGLVDKSVTALGTWKSATAKEAASADAWSYFNGSYFMCYNNPPTSVAEQEERETAQLIADLRRDLWWAFKEGNIRADQFPSHDTNGEMGRANSMGRAVGWLIGQTLTDGVRIEDAQHARELTE